MFNLVRKVELDGGATKFYEVRTYEPIEVEGEEATLFRIERHGDEWGVYVTSEDGYWIHEEADIAFAELLPEVLAEIERREAEGTVYNDADSYLEWLASEGEDDD